MLRGLAEYAMSGRRQAATVAILFGLLPLLNLFSAAVVALVTLRKGLGEGFLVLLWAALPAGLQLIVGDFSPLLMLGSAWLGAQLLRQSGSWSSSLLLVSGLGILAQLSLVLQDSYISQLVGVFQNMIDNGMALQLQDAGGMRPASAEEIAGLLLQFYGAYLVLLTTLCLSLARHWQALLYNPGGFREEFHALRGDPRVAVLLLALIVGGMSGTPMLETWVPILCLLPLVNGIAFCHWLVAKRKLGSHWLVLAYLALLFMAPAIVGLGFADSFVNLRQRLQNREPME